MPNEDKDQLTTTPTAFDIWLCKQFSKWLGRDVSDLDTPFADLGLDSIGAVTLSADLEEAIGIPIEGSILWEYSTIRLLSRYLTEEIQRHGAEINVISSSDQHSVN